MTEQECVFGQLWFAVWCLGMEIALQRLGMASTAFGGNGTQTAFAPIPGQSAQGERPTVH